MDPENNNGIISDLLTFVMENESHKKADKAWTRCYVLYEPPGTDRSSLIGAMASYLKFDIYNVDLMSLSSISELKKLLGSTRNHSLIAIRDYNLWLRFPQPKNQVGNGVFVFLHHCFFPPSSANRPLINLANFMIVDYTTVLMTLDLVGRSRLELTL